MTQMTPTEIPQRRHIDPPWLWFSVFLGSVLIHLFGLGVLSRLMVEQQASAIGAAPIPVELIAMRPESKIRKSIPSPVVANAKISGQKSGTRSQKLRGRGQGTGKGKQGKIQTSPQKTSSLPKNTLKTIPKPKPSAHRYLKNKPSPLPIKPTPIPYPKNQPSPSPIKPAPKSTPSPQPSPSPQSGGLVATLSNVRLPGHARDIPNLLAQPQQLQQPLPQDLFLASNNLRHKDFHVYLVINDKGKVDLTKSRVVNPSVDSKEAWLVVSIFKTWAFHPAIQGGKPVYGELEVDLKIAPRPIKFK